MCQTASISPFGDLGHPVPGGDGLVARGKEPMAKVTHICRMVAHAVALIGGRFL